MPPPSVPLPPTIERPITFGEKVCGCSAILYQTGELFVAEQRVSQNGKLYQVVMFTFKDNQSVICRIKRIFYDGQVYHAEQELKPYHGQTIRLGLLGVNPKKVEEDIGVDGISRVYTYLAKDIFLDKRPETLVALILDTSIRWDNDLPENILPVSPPVADLLSELDV